MGIRRTPFEARNYKKLLQSLQKTKLISGRCLDTLMKKADRFLSSKNIEKEKEAYKQNIREQLLINPNATAVKLAQPAQKEAIYQTETPESDEQSLEATEISEGQIAAHIPDDVDSDDTVPEDQTSRRAKIESQYLKGFKDRTHVEQIEKHE